MNLFNKKKDYTVIIGCGRFGSTLANTLSDEGINILVIDRNRDSFSKFEPANYLEPTTLIGDATDIEVLRAAQVEKATVVIAAAGNDNTNIMIMQMVKELFKNEHVVARIYDPERECVYREFDIDVVSPAALFAKEICNRINGTKKEVVI